MRHECTACEQCCVWRGAAVAERGDARVDPVSLRGLDQRLCRALCEGEGDEPRLRPTYRRLNQVAQSLDDGRDQAEDSDL